MLNMREMRKKKGLTLKQLGEIVGVTEATMNHYEHERRKPNYEMLLKISEALDCTVNDLLYKLPENKKSLVTEDDEGSNELNDYANSIFKQLSTEDKIFLISQMQARLQGKLTQDVPKESD